jgi:uncharacterized protein (TIGR00106 family)
MVLLEFSIIPLDKGESLSVYVARIIDIIDKSGVAYRLNPMGTVLEGDYDEVMNVVKDCFNELEKDCSRISLSIKIDFRKGEQSRINKKIERIESLLGRQIKQ